VVQASYENIVFPNGFCVFQGHIWIWEHAKTMKGYTFFLFGPAFDEGVIQNQPIN